MCGDDIGDFYFPAPTQYLGTSVKDAFRNVVSCEVLSTFHFLARDIELRELWSGRGVFDDQFMKDGIAAPLSGKRIQRKGVPDNWSVVGSPTRSFAARSS